MEKTGEGAIFGHLVLLNLHSKIFIYLIYNLGLPLVKISKFKSKKMFKV